MGTDEVEIDLTLGRGKAHRNTEGTTYDTSPWEIKDRVSDHLAEDDSEDMVEIPVWHEANKELEELYSEESLDKAADLVLKGKVSNLDRKGLYTVQGSEDYVCNVVELQGSTTPAVTCTCPNGSSRAGRPTCYHTAAALMTYLELNPQEYKS